METGSVIYRGNVRVYLQGKGALQPVDMTNSEFYTYFIGSEESSIKIKDFRKEPKYAATAKIENKLDGEFADIFNQPAEIRIIDNNGDVQIEMRKGRQDNSSPMLWLGVISDGKMPVQKITWETLKPIRENIIAFVALVNY